jgi:putative FmdB family regulatory protein
MPIYEYRCSSCGHQQEFLQKVSDPLRTACPACGKEALTKLVTAAGFQLKGSGWYATDFRDKPKAGASKPQGAGEAQGESKSESKGEPKAESKSEGKSDAKPEAKPATSTKSDGGKAA